MQESPGINKNQSPLAIKYLRTRAALASFSGSLSGDGREGQKMSIEFDKWSYFFLGLYLIIKLSERVSKNNQILINTWKGEEKLGEEWSRSVCKFEFKCWPIAIISWSGGRITSHFEHLFYSPKVVMLFGGPTQKMSSQRDSIFNQLYKSINLLLYLLNYCFLVHPFLSFHHPPEDIIFSYECSHTM